MVYKFGGGTADGDGQMKAVLGGKGANLAEMAKMGLPVPPGFTIPCQLCIAYQTDADGVVETIRPAVLQGLASLKDQFGYMPLVSVRSGAPVSMPGMMDTILNVGITSQTLGSWIKRLGHRAALDSRRRLLQMMGETAFGVPKKVFDEILDTVKADAGVTEDKDLGVDQLGWIIERFEKAFQAVVQKPFPDTLEEQVEAAIHAVFRSWNTERAVLYRQLNKIPDDMGTAVNVQAMVFGNMNDRSGSGVLFTRNPSTGENKLYGEFLTNAQGEDVVAGTRTPMKIETMALWDDWKPILKQIVGVCNTLEQHFRDMQDIEFTVQDGTLFMLQCRTGKREAAAAFRIAVEMVGEGLIDRPTALKRITRAQLKTTLRPSVSPSFKTKPAFTGLPACGGVAVGKAVFTAKAAVEAAAKGKPVILVAKETTPDDFAGMVAARAVVTALGGATSHAAVVARSMDKTCVTGCNQLHEDGGGAFEVKAADGSVIALTEHSTITVCGDTGRVWIDQTVPVTDGNNAHVATVTDWILEQMGAIPCGPRLSELPAGPVQVNVGDWAFDRKEAERFIADVKARPGGAKGVTLNLDFEVDAADALLWGVCEAPGQAAAVFQTFALHQVIQENASGGAFNGLCVKVSDPALQKAAKAAGFAINGTAQTVADLLAGMPATPEFIAGVIGGETAWSKLQAMLGAAGIVHSKAKVALHRDAAAFAFLAA